MAAVEYLTVNHLKTKDLIRIFSKITIHDDMRFNGTPCWIWCGHRRKHSGYGTVSVQGEELTAHRLMYAWLVGPIPRGRGNGELDHLCRVPACCNPLHLEFVPHRINLLRGVGFAAVSAKKTHCKRGHPLSGDNLFYVKNGTRHCRECRNQAGRDWRKKNNKHYLEMAARYRKKYRLAASRSNPPPD
jgi:hypothetical protein